MFQVWNMKGQNQGLCVGLRSEPSPWRRSGTLPIRGGFVPRKTSGVLKPVSIARCEEHFPRDRRYKYHARALPIGYPDTAVVCAMPGCDQPALVWLTPSELNAFANGERMFDITPRGLKLRVTDEPPTVVAPDINRLPSDDPAAQAVGTLGKKDPPRAPLRALPSAASRLCRNRP